METSKKTYLKHFLYFYKELGNRIFIGLALSIFVGLLDGFGLAMFLPLLQMIDGVSTSSPEQMGNLKFLADFLEGFGFGITINVVLAFIVVLFVLKGIAKFAEGCFHVYIINFFIVRLRLSAINLFSKYSFKSFIKADSGRIQNTISGEVLRVVEAFRAYFKMIQNAILVFVYLLLAFLSNPEFAIFVIVAGGLTGFLFKSIYTKTKNLSTAVTSDNNRFQGLLIQIVGFYKYLKSTGRVGIYAEKLKESINRIERSNLRIGKIQAFIVASREPILIVVVAMMIFIQSAYLGKSLGVIILSLLFLYRALNFLLETQAMWVSFLAYVGSIENTNDFIKELEDNPEHYGDKKFESLQNKLELKNSYFSYNKDDYILKNISLEIQKNKTIAFIGESGSGKTTIVNILTGLLPIDKGNYKVDGVESSEIDMGTFQNKVGYITQEPVVFDDDVFNNVTFWDKRTPENLQRFWEVLRKASVEDFVLSLPKKELAPLGNNGIMMSGGQKQRISIARELYKNIDILIMDEATSALDSETEKAIQENIDMLKGSYTILIVAHRLSTIKNADEIILMNQGEITAKGTFQELLQTNEKFKQMVDLQKL